jgi:hypothetical protein
VEQPLKRAIASCPGAHSRDLSAKYEDPLSDLATLEQLLDQAPARRANEVSKRRAIGILAPKLDELRGRAGDFAGLAAWARSQLGPADSNPVERRGGLADNPRYVNFDAACS